MSTAWTTEMQGSGEHAEVNGINVYYETHGSGRPLILLHGALGSGEMFGPILPTLAENDQVIMGRYVISDFDPNDTSAHDNGRA